MVPYLVMFGAIIQRRVINLNENPKRLTKLTKKVLMKKELKYVLL